MAASTTHVQEFLALPIKYRESSSAVHWLYCKQHSVREKTAGKPVGRTLFIVNVPPYFTEQCMRRLFDECGEITDIFFHKKPTSALPELSKSKFFDRRPPLTGYKVSYVVFSTGSELESALNLKWKKPKLLYKTNDKKQPKSGIEKWKSDYDNQIASGAELQAEIDSFMDEHDKKVSDEQMLLKATEGEADEDGWVTVTKKGRKPGFARKESVEQKVLEKEGKKKSKKQLLNFYTFQIRESKMNHLAELRQKFEEDKKRITQLRQSRRFKPF